MILVTGATGNIGRELVPILLEAGQPVRVFTRDERKVAHLDACVERAVSISTIPLHNLYSAEALPLSDVHFWKSFDRIFSWTGAGDSGFVKKMKEIHPDACIASWRFSSGTSRIYAFACVGPSTSRAPASRKIRRSSASDNGPRLPLSASK